MRARVPDKRRSAGVASRRAFLRHTLAAAGVTLFPGTPAIASQPDLPAASGVEQPALAAFDALMTAYVREQQAPGAALAVSAGSRLVYARGFGLADRRSQRAVQPTDLFRIASLSKPVTAVAVLQLVDRGRLAPDARVWELLRLPEPADARWKRVTVLRLLQHTGGWDRIESTDPMFRTAPIARALGMKPPAGPEDIIRYMLGQPLDFDPGLRHAYSNFGYCLLGRIIERVSGSAYERHVQREVLAPLGIRRMRLARTLAAHRADDEVSYYTGDDRTVPAVVGNLRERVPLPYGGWSIEVMDAHGGWLASAVDLVRFACAFDAPEKSMLLKPATVAAMYARPDGLAGYEPDGRQKAVYYACGWRVRHLQRGGINGWHTGSLDGTSTLLVRRFDGINFAVLFNARSTPDGRRLSDVLEPRIHAVIDRIRSWPAIDQFDRLLPRG